MLGIFGSRSRGESGAPFVFRVSDAVEVPCRGFLLRLRLLEGEPRVADLGPGSSLRLRSPHGEERTVRILDLAVTGGRATQRRLERTRELDVLISVADAVGEESAVEVGWVAVGPVGQREERAA